MSFVVITSGEIATGEPVSAPTQTKIRNNFDDHESRIETLEASISDFFPIILRIGGPYGVYNSVTKTTFNSALRITGVRILQDVAGSAGTLEIDLKIKRGVGSFTSIFSTKPLILYSAGDDAISSSGTIDPTMKDVIAGDILKLDITSAQTDGRGFAVRIDWDRG